jgi:hypothetical protein
LLCQYEISFEEEKISVKKCFNPTLNKLYSDDLSKIYKDYLRSD